MSSQSNSRVIRFECELGPFLLGKDERRGTIIFAEQCACDLDQDGFDEITAAVQRMESDDLANGPGVFIVRWGEDGIACQRIGLVH